MKLAVLGSHQGQFMRPTKVSLDSTQNLTASQELGSFQSSACELTPFTLVFDSEARRVRANSSR